MADENALVVDKRELAQVVEQVQSFQDLLGKDAFKRQLAMALPRHITPDRLLRVTMTSIRTTPKLLECSIQSMYACVMGCAQLGLLPDGFLGQAYLVPFFNSKANNGRGRLDAQLIPGYRGLITLARNSGEVKDVDAQVVYKNDPFKISFGTNRHIEHSPCLDGERGDPMGSYAVFWLIDNTPTFDFMTTSDIEKVRAVSKASNSGPWVKFWAEMAKKTIIRRKSKTIPMSVEKPEANRFATAVALDDIAAIGKSQLPMLLDEPEQDDEVIDVSGPSALAAAASEKSRRGRPSKAAQPAEPPADAATAPDQGPQPGPEPSPRDELMDAMERVKDALAGLTREKREKAIKDGCGKPWPETVAECSRVVDCALKEKEG